MSQAVMKVEQFDAGDRITQKEAKKINKALVSQATAANQMVNIAKNLSGFGIASLAIFLYKGAETFISDDWRNIPGTEFGWNAALGLGAVGLGAVLEDQRLGWPMTMAGIGLTAPVMGELGSMLGESAQEWWNS